MASSQTQTTGPSKRSRSKARKTGEAIEDVLRGNVVTSDLFARHKLMFFAIFMLIMFFIITKYECMTGMEEIRRRENELEVVKTERIRERSHYMSRIRESSMSNLADSIHPGLSIRTAPPFEINY